jgi:chromosome condensin MukBEF complex kleisin-like MukF subunit
METVDLSKSEAIVTQTEVRKNSPERTVRKSENMKAMEREAARIRWLLAINPNTPPPVLDQLANDEATVLLERIAENPKTHHYTLARLANHADQQVRAAVAENANSSIKTIWRLARDTSVDVRLRVAESYYVPVTVLRVLAMDENPYVQQRAQKTITRIVEEVNTLRRA